MYNKNLGVNFLKRWQFECKFDRDPKMWSFKQLMDLYVRAKERADRRRKEFSDFIYKIVEEFEPNHSTKPGESGSIEVYFDRDGITCKYSIRKDEHFGWAYSTDRVSFSIKDIVLAREQKINFLIDNKRKFELGEELKRLEKMKSVFDRHVFGIIEEAVNEKLCENFKKVKNHLIPKVIKVDLGGKIYYAALTKDSRNSGYDWKSFEILGPEYNDIIKL
jgi:hypothetical protein